MTEAPKIIDAGGWSMSHHAPRPRRLPQWLYYFPWGDRRSLAEPIAGDEQGARRMLQGLIDLYGLPTDGKWYRGPKQAL